MEKSSKCFSTAGLLRHLVGLGRKGPRRCLWAACPCASAASPALLPGMLLLPEHSWAPCFVRRRLWVLLDHGQALRGLLAEDTHPSAAPGIDTGGFSASEGREG